MLTKSAPSPFPVLGPKPQPEPHSQETPPPPPNAYSFQLCGFGDSKPSFPTVWSNYNGFCGSVWGSCYSHKHLQLETVEEAALKKKKARKKKRKKNLPTPINPQSPKFKTKQKPKITTATALPLQQACPCATIQPISTVQIIWFLRILITKCPLPTAPGENCIEASFHPLGSLPERGSEASHTLYPTATHRKRFNCSTSSGRKRKEKGRLGYPSPSGSPWGQLTLCVIT